MLISKEEHAGVKYACLYLAIITLLIHISELLNP